MADAEEVSEVRLREAEAERITLAYAARSGLERLYAEDAPDQRLRTADRIRRVRAGMRTRGIAPGQPVLEIGCGTGREIARFRDEGWSPADLCGLDLLADRVAEARQVLPGADLRQGDASALPWAEGSFALVGQWTMMSSVRDDRLRARILAEAWRVLKPGGWLLSYDMRWVRPDRPLRPWTSRMLREGLPEARPVTVEQLSLLPPLARRVAGWPMLHDALARLPFLLGHELVWARKPEAP
jgi:SAM-dependent methyltransferase